MIILNRVDGSSVVVNCDEIEFVDGSHDTTLSLKSGRKIIVTQSPDEIIELVIQFKRQCNSPNDVKMLSKPDLVDGE
jgi:flagellar protein FlbD